MPFDKSGDLAAIVVHIEAYWCDMLNLWLPDPHTERHIPIQSCRNRKGSRGFCELPALRMFTICVIRGCQIHSADNTFRSSFV